MLNFGLILSILPSERTSASARSAELLVPPHPVVFAPKVAVEFNDPWACLFTSGYECAYPAASLFIFGYEFCDPPGCLPEIFASHCFCGLFLQSFSG